MVTQTAIMYEYCCVHSGVGERVAASELEGAGGCRRAAVRRSVRQQDAPESSTSRHDPHLLPRGSTLCSNSFISFYP